MGRFGDIYEGSSDWQSENWKTLINMVRGSLTTKPETAIDLGCGTGKNTITLTDYFPSLQRIIGVDSDSSMLEIAHAKYSNSNIEYLLYNLESDQLPPLVSRNIFDIVLSNYSLHWVPNKLNIFNNLNKVTKTGSMFGLCTCSELPSLLNKLDTLIRMELGVRSPSPYFYLNIEDWNKLLENQGWTVVEAKRVEQIHTVKGGSLFLEQWASASTGKAFYKVGIKNIQPHILQKLIATIDQTFGPGDWTYPEDTILLVARRK